MTRLVAALAGLGLLVAACTGGDAGAPDATRTPQGSATPPVERETESPAPDGRGSALAALERLCTVAEPDLDETGSEVPPEGDAPPAIEQVMREVEQIRGFGFTRPVVADPATQRRIGRDFQRYLEGSFPEDLNERRTTVWRTIGVIEPEGDIREELAEYGGSQVIGYYDTITGKLVFQGAEDPSPLESVTLAHELTHAIEDQRFGLERLDVLSARCRDDRSQSAVALVEGTATFFMYEWARTFLTPEEQTELVQESASQEAPAADVSPFIEALQIWPYTAGLAFVTHLEREGGLDAVDAAFRDLPVSSEQIIHPERYPNDVPTAIDIPDLSAELGTGWSDLDVMEVGEVWLDTAFGLRLDDDEGERASAGWDGGLYRAWSDGADVAIVLDTVWDSGEDAAEFADSFQRWIAEGETVGAVLEPDGPTVRTLIASDGTTLDELRRAAS